MKEKKNPVCSECPVHHLCGINWRDEFGRIDCNSRVEEFKKKEA